MVDERDILEEIREVQALRNLVSAYEEIASFRMKKTRDAVLYTRKYLDAINDIFERVRTSYAFEARHYLKKRGKKAGLTFLAHNGKTVAVLLSANTGLYGEIIYKTFTKFVDEVNKGEVEATIIGKHGLSLFLGVYPNKPYTYFDLPDQDVKPADLIDIIKHIVQYEEIHVYYGKFLSVIKQEPTSLTVTAEIKMDGKEGQKPVSYIFEPSLEKILMFFETEIFASLFEQSVSESQLAKYASRVVAMDKADINIKDHLKKLNLEKMRASHLKLNKKQLNTFPSLLMLEGGLNAQGQ